MVSVLLINLETIPRLKVTTPHLAREVVSILGLKQHWGMFAPYPYRADGWFVVEGVLEDDTRLDLWNQTGTGAMPLFSKPPNIADTYRNYLWRKYLTNLFDRGQGSYPSYFGRYLCRVGGEPDRAGRRIKRVAVYHMTVVTPLPSRPRPEPRRNLLWQGDCPRDQLSP